MLIKPRSRTHHEYHNLFFRVATYGPRLQWEATIDSYPPGGFGFDCDAQGNVDVSKLPPASYLNFLKCTSGGSWNGGEVWWSDVQTFFSWKEEPGIIKCDDCGEEFEFHHHFTNTCKCGADYNGSGQRLAPRSQWGEETGETYEEIIAHEVSETVH